ncbi:MAG: S8 family serine peptidase [Acidimicrobiia bacterium]|nr:S8 family serine peptidase [Acidimicrobiia bacterium]
MQPLTSVGTRFGAIALTLALAFTVTSPAQDGATDVETVDGVWSVLSTDTAIIQESSTAVTGSSWSSENGDFSPRESTGSWYQLQRNTMGTQQFWKNGYWGQGIGVAVIDTGALPVEGLSNAGTVVNGLDISFDSQNPDVLHLDGYGHGVHMAGLIAGSTGDKTPKGTTHRSFIGTAPSAQVISVKTGSAEGAVDVSQIIAAIDWVVQHKDDPGLNIRVLNLSFGFDSVQDAAIDPLSHAVENAWRAGIVVVAAAGNDGNAAPLRMPARNPYVIAVGAYDQDYGPGSGAVSSFSNCGTASRSVDLVAPGRSIVGLRAPGSYLDEMYPNARAGMDYFKGTGTSQAAALVSGSAALILSQRPDLTPDDVKNVLMDSAHPVAGSAICAGAGALDLWSAYETPANGTVQAGVRSSGDGSLDLARGSRRLALNGEPLVGEQDIFGNPFDADEWALLSAEETSWDGGDWMGEPWSGTSWSGLSWSGLSWSGLSWSGLSWSGLSWSGLSWSGLSWSGLSWSGLSWSSGSWSGLSWSGLSWSSLAS